MSLSEPNTHFSVFISGIIFGIIFFQSFISAPLIFKHIDKKNSSAYIRKVFPRIFLIIPLLSLISLLVSYFKSKYYTTDLLIVCLTSIFLPLICYLLIPSTNKATDNGNSKKFKILHTVSVLLTFIVFLINLYWII